jgi:hypothetical protein
MMGAMHTMAGVALVALLVATGACSDDDPESSAQSTTTTSAAACEPDDLDPDELEAATVEVVPDGFELQPIEDYDTGPSDQAKAISDDSEDGAEAALAEFRRGYQWIWTDAADSQLISFVYEFCDGDAAQGYVDRGLEFADQQATEAGYEITEFDVPDLDRESALTAAGDGARVAFVDVLEGPFYVRTQAFFPDTADAAEVQAYAGDLAVAQVEALDDV